MRTIGEQLANLLGVHEFARGAWFSVQNEFLYIGLHQWSTKPGTHPVILVLIAGPNATVMPRSASIKSGRSHSAHPIRHEASCAITKNGYVKTATPITLDARLLTAGNFSCYEPDSSALLVEIGIG